MAAIGVAMSAASAGYAAYAAHEQAEMQADIAKRNADIQKQQARDAEKRGEQKVSAHRARINQLVGRQRAAIGASGAVVDVGAPLDLIEDTVAIGELEALTIQNNAMREAWGYEAVSSNSLIEADAARFAGKVGVTSSLLGGAAQTFGLLSQYQTGATSE
jgi:hypothetical protein